MGRVITICLMAAGVLCAAAAALAQDVTWQRRTQGCLDGVQLAMYHGGASYTKPAFADIDGDGDGDLFVGEHDGYLNYFRNLGGMPAQWFCETTSWDSIDVGKQCSPAFWDCDIDGDLDMFLGNEDGNLVFYRNNGTATNPVFTFVDSSYQDIDVGYHAVPAFADLDGDNLADLLIGNNSGNFAYYHNGGTQGNPAFTLVTNHYQDINLFMKSTLYVVDVTNDGLPDLFLSSLNGPIYFYRNDGPAINPTYTNMGEAAAVDHNGAPTLWDLNGDGLLDLISGRSDGYLTVWMNTGTLQNPRWQYTVDNLAYFDNGYYSMLTLGDLNGDGLLDMLVSRGLPGIHYLQNIGTADSAAWQLVSEYYGGINLPQVEAPCLNDMDGDGDLDLLVGCYNGTLTYYQNTGTPQNATWAAPVHNYANLNLGGWSAPTFADIDGDGDKDMFVGSAAGTIRYLRRDGPPTNPVWADLGNVPGVTVGSHAVPAFADLDGDGDLDLYVGNGSNAGNIYFYRNTGSQYWPVWSFVTPVYQNWDFGDQSAPVFADLNNDDRLDLIIGCKSGGLYHYLNIADAHVVNVYLTPIGAPIYIHNTGGWFAYNITVYNNEVMSETFQIWTMVIMPSGSFYGPVLGPFTLTMQPNTNYTRLRVQNVPAGAPPGVYTYRAYVGLYPAKWDSSSFNFTKLTSGEGQVENEWRCTGDPFPGETLIESPIVSATQPYKSGLQGANPNPFNPSTTISYQLSSTSHVTLKVYDVTGKLVTTLVDGWRETGNHKVTFDGSKLASGVYLYQLTVGSQTTTKKLMLIK